MQIICRAAKPKPNRTSFPITPPRDGRGRTYRGNAIERGGVGAADGTSGERAKDGRSGVGELHR